MLDTSGDGLHKRGYRRNATGAPIKETLAAAIADLGRVRRDSIVADPFCGSGTMAVSYTHLDVYKRQFHNLGNVLVRRLVNQFFKGDVVDIMTGYRAFGPLFVKSFPVLSKGFEIETEMTIHALDKNLRLENLPVTYRDRPEGSESKLNTYSDGFKVLKTRCV